MPYTTSLKNTLLALVAFTSCSKMVDIKVPFQILITDKVFSNTEDARSAVAGMFYTMGQSGENFSNASTTILCGMSADELRPFLEGADNYSQFRLNSLTDANALLYTNLWAPAYKVIYNANAVITQLHQSEAISQNNRDSLMATARFVRAFVYFNLVNYFGEVPLVTSIDYNKTATQGREKTNLVYDHIIRDLTIAQAFLPEKYQHQQRVMPTKWAAKALLARAYLYTKQFAKAIAEADTVISQPALYELSGNLSNVFSVSSREAIWQLEANSRTVSGNVTLEGLRFLPFPAVTQSQPSYYLTQSLTQQFETGDKRLAEWTVVNSYQAGHYRLPYKYKEGRAQQAAGAAPKEFNTVLRLAELYLIRAEACAQAGLVSQARADVNKIRTRAGLQELTPDTRERLMQALQQEKQKEFFAEWGHRWMDLKRWDLANEILAPQKGSNWQPTDQLYPLPVTELSFAPNLTQNPGY